MIKIDKYKLGVLFSIANANFRDLDKNDLDDQQFVALCWTKAVSEYLIMNVQLDLPQRRLLESVDED